MFHGLYHRSINQSTFSRRFSVLAYYDVSGSNYSLTDDCLYHVDLKLPDSYSMVIVGQNSSKIWLESRRQTPVRTVALLMSPRRNSVPMGRVNRVPCHL